ncbi:hypothetical protein NQ315_003285 [Exocentrus adspersus]|uniref:Transposase n=1 Tax=Exocentrus adspersus TaxID=1586481 RepID=A0AAV8V591_9CUCU|nr:hypothetical protein NQ315_003285 [Exocentrus adspersus]
MSYLTENLKIEILMMIGFGDRMRTQTEVAALFQRNHPDLPPLNRSTVSKIEAYYKTHGHVRNIPRQRPQKVTEDTKLNILLRYEESPITPARQIAREYNLCKKTILKILKSAGKRPFKMTPVQELLDDDSDRRVEFCESMMNFINDGQILPDWILFSDEAIFTLHGEVNRQNCRYYAETNPHWIVEQHTQHRAKLNVWAGVIEDRIIGPIFFDETLTGDRYRHFLENTLTLRSLQDEFYHRLALCQEVNGAHFEQLINNNK